MFVSPSGREISMRIKTFFMVLVCLIIVNTIATAGIIRPFDGQRKGFIANMAFGPGLTIIKSTNGELEGSITKGTVGITYRFGYAPSDNLQLYYTHRSYVYASKIGEHYNNWVDAFEGKRAAGYILTTLAVPVMLFFTDQHIVLGLGGTYHVRPDVPSWFFELGLGPSATADPYEWEGSSPFPGGSKTGLGIFGAVGYEFTRYIRAEAQFLWAGRSWKKDGIEKKWSATSLALEISFIGY